MKRFKILLLIAGMTLLVGCSQKHQHFWADATCTTPRTCNICGETDGAPLGHSWVDATCTTPKTCSSCGKTEGSALGHSWVEATCTTPKTCSVCGETEGDPIEHDLDYNGKCNSCGEQIGVELTETNYSKYLDIHFTNTGWSISPVLDVTFVNVHIPAAIWQKADDGTHHCYGLNINIDSEGFSSGKWDSRGYELGVQKKFYDVELENITGYVLK